MSPPADELSANYVAELGAYFPDTDDLAALTALVEHAIWCDWDIAAALAEALLAVVTALALATHDAIARGQTDADRFRGWVSGPLDQLSQQIAALEAAITITEPGCGHIALDAPRLAGSAANAPARN